MVVNLAPSCTCISSITGPRWAQRGARDADRVGAGDLDDDAAEVVLTGVELEVGRHRGEVRPPPSTAHSAPAFTGFLMT